MNAAIIEFVWRRAPSRCEYCRLPKHLTVVPFQIDHIVARKHGGKDVVSNLALACFYCNSRKGTNLVSIDPLTKKLSPLFNPRRHKWAVHFAWKEMQLTGRTAIGRTTIRCLDINSWEMVEARENYWLSQNTEWM